MPIRHLHCTAGSYFQASLAVALTFTLLAVALISTPALAQDESEEKADPENIKTLETVMEFAADGSAAVTEKFVVDFSKKARHGIYRNFPLEYFDREGRKIQIEYHIQGITDEKGQPWQYQLSEEDSNLSVRIGDPEITIRDVVTYNIKYSVKTPVIMTADGAELYWNVTGTQWTMPIGNIKIKFFCPPRLAKSRSTWPVLRDRKTLQTSYAGCAWKKTAQSGGKPSCRLPRTKALSSGSIFPRHILNFQYHSRKNRAQIPAA